MRLLFCIKAMNNPGGGAERVMAEVTGGLAARGHEIAALSFDPPGGCSFYTFDPRIERVELGIAKTTDSVTLLSILHRIATLRVNVRSYAPEVAIGFMHSMFIPLGLALLGTSIPMIASEHIVPEHYRNRPIEALLLCFTPLMAKSIACVSEQVRQSYPFFLARKMTVVPNPVTMKSFALADVLGRRKPRKVLLAVGRLDPQKDHITLVKAFAEIADKLPDWDLRIVGNGRLRPQLESMTGKLGLSERILLPGTINDIAKEYISAQLFVQPSRYESFSLTTAEALAHGLPVVGFDDCQGVNQLIRPGVNGYLVCGRGDRSKSLGRALMSLMQDNELRVQLARSATDTLRQHRLENVLDRWEQLFNKVTIGKKSVFN